ncbi:efflux transporter periplasmic adaptor subunit [Massilia sp. KIM]|uniref:efflux RND transporter periplasmic adaptor subunit n=1 Tax=Massilia sp. KIM TaxID=1955422 RepID=UPI00098FB114|nr:efflux RND transporter periplasmic adaptor subunit [Massilia sp. KIM]OON60305.1 efflux transporter periplasmic adaptor subunit [Massilia sp. KIM]
MISPPYTAALRASALAAAVAAVLSACSANGAQTPAAPAAPQVSVAAVLERPVAETQEFSGRLEAIERVQIRARVAGYIAAVHFKPGALVRKGQLLVQIDPRPFRAEADRSGALAAAARARADLAKLELERAGKLLADKAIAQREFDERSASWKELDASARAAAAQAEAARLNLSFTEVRSPIDGRVGKDELTVGNLVDASNVLTSVVSLERIYASFEGDEATYLRVARRAGKDPVTVQVGLAGEDGFPHEGKLEFVDNQLDTRSGSVRLRALLANRDGSLAPGLFARVRVGGGQARATLLVSDRAVGTDQSHKFVYVVKKDGAPERRPVVLGPAVDGLRVVREGLRAGDMVVVSGLQRIRPGVNVAPTVVPMTATGEKG